MAIGGGWDPSGAPRGLRSSCRGPIGGLGLHVAFDCLNVVGNGVVIGGVTTHGLVLVSGEPMEPGGARALTAVVDNGRSAYDPPDQEYCSLLEELFGVGCTRLEPVDLGPVFGPLHFTRGQVVLR